MYRTTIWAAAVAAIVIAVAFVAIRSAGRSDSSEQEAPAAESTAFPVTIEHKFGSTEIPEAPERVVTVGYTESDAVLALGVEPVGVREFLGGYGWRERPWAQDALGGAEETAVGSEQINFEAVAAQRPDLIVGINSGMTESDYRRLSRIAPTIAQSGDFIDFGMPWDEQAATIGRALGREDDARRVIDEVKAKFAEARREHPEFEGTTAILAYGGPDGYGAYSSQDTRSRFFADLGFETPERVDELAGDGFYTEFSQEQFRLMDQEVVIMFGTQEDVLANPVFRRLKAVQEDRVIYLDLGDQFSGALGYASPLSLPFLLDEAVPKLAAAADGDPATKVEQPR
jgi:iron-siderophore transport system substrate-binding protein